MSIMDRVRGWLYRDEKGAAMVRARMDWLRVNDPDGYARVLALFEPTTPPGGHHPDETGMHTHKDHRAHYLTGLYVWGSDRCVRYAPEGEVVGGE